VNSDGILVCADAPEAALLSANIIRAPEFVPEDGGVYLVFMRLIASIDAFIHVNNLSGSAAELFFNSHARHPGHV
jgi:hypothetical protein